MTNRPIALACLLALIGCDACDPKINPSLDNGTTGDEETDTPVDTADSADTEDTGPLDTAPPPLCAHEEVEPNDASNHEYIELETMICGVFNPTGGEAADLEWFDFEVQDATWLKVDVNAATIGSSADPSLYLESEDGHYMLIESDLDSTDPKVVFPLPEGVDDWSILLAELNSLSGERYIWEFLVSTTKAPLEWNTDEIEPNNLPEDAVELTEGMVLFGQFSAQDDLEQFYIDPPEGDHDISIEVIAKSKGSAVDSQLVIQRLVYVDDDPDDEIPPVADLQRLASAAGGSGTSPDAKITYTADGTERLYLTLKEYSDKFGPAHWYTIAITSIVPTPEDTGADTGATK